MPYIKQQRRKELEGAIYILKELGVKADGDLNYILYRFCKEQIHPSYNNYKNYLGELRQCVTEIERRLLAPYEDKKIKENGDI